MIYKEIKRDAVVMWKQGCPWMEIDNMLEKYVSEDVITRKQYKRIENEIDRIAGNF